MKLNNELYLLFLIWYVLLTLISFSLNIKLKSKLSEKEELQAEESEIMKNFYAESSTESTTASKLSITEKSNIINLDNNSNKGDPTTESEKNYSTTTTNMLFYKKNKEGNKIIIRGWLTVSSKSYNHYPVIEMHDGSQLNIPFDKNGNRINPSYNFMDEKTRPPNNLFFYFSMSRMNLSYKVNKEAHLTLSSINMKSITTLTPYHDFGNDGFCFQLKDIENKNWKLCAINLEEKNNWICAIRKALKQPSHRCDGRNTALDEKEVVVTTNENIIAISSPSRQCNQNWNYLNEDTWECECSEGREQSPIDLPEKSNATKTTIKPLFQFMHIRANATDSTLDGMVVKGEFIKIRYKENLIRIMHPNLGRVITFDGTIYQAEEIQFHTPGEHTINGRDFDMEMQVIYYGITKGDIGKQFILCFLFQGKAGSYNRFINDIDFFNLPNEFNPEENIVNNIFIPKVFYTTDDTVDDDVSTIKPFSMYTYQGSITSPPCLEDTIVVVADEVLKISISSLNLFREALTKNNSKNYYIDFNSIKNNRKVQNRNERPVYYYSSEDCPEIKPKVQSKPTGHYEKVKRKLKEYFYVNGEEPSGLPESYVINPQEVYGLENLGFSK